MAKKEHKDVDGKRRAFTRPAARKNIEPKTRGPKRTPASVDDYDVHTIRPGKSQGQSTQTGRVRDRSRRPSYDIYDQVEVSEDSDEEFAPFRSRAGPRTERIRSQRSPSPRQPPRYTKNDSHRNSNRDLSIEPPPRSARHDQPRRNQSSGRYRRDRDSSTDSSQSPSPPPRRAKSRARHDRDRSRSLDYHSKPRFREYARPIRDPPNHSAGLPRSATFPSQTFQRHTTDADHNFGPSSRSQTLPDLHGQSYNSAFPDPVFPGGGGFHSFSTSYTSPSGHHSYTTSTFDASSPFNQPFFSGGSAPRPPRNNATFFPERPGRTSQYDTYPQSSPNAHGPSWEGGAMDDILEAGHEHIDRAIENEKRRRMQQNKPRDARERGPCYESTGPNHNINNSHSGNHNHNHNSHNHNNHDHSSRYDHHRYHDKRSWDHNHDHTSNSHHHHDYEHFQKQRERARSQARSHKHDDSARPQSSPLAKDDDASHDYYTTLRIPPTATLDEVRAAVKKRRIATHPDRCKKPGMTETQKSEIDEEAKRVGEAAECLTDRNARARYDCEYHSRKRFGDMRM